MPSDVQQVDTGRRSSLDISNIKSQNRISNYLHVDFMQAKYSSVDTVALRLAVLLKRSEKTRARVSEKTLRILSGRSTLRDSFVVGVRNALEELSVVSVRLDRGGFALIATSALEGAPTALVKNLMPDFRKLSDDNLWNELDLPGNEVDE
jgi:hypothetical protein